jgi:hypothetical protein
VLKLGTARHHQGLLRGIDNVDDIGCFALTELGFGELVCDDSTARSWVPGSKRCSLFKRPEHACCTVCSKHQAVCLRPPACTVCDTVQSLQGRSAAVCRSLRSMLVVLLMQKQCCCKQTAAAQHPAEFASC